MFLLLLMYYKYAFASYGNRCFIPDHLPGVQDGKEMNAEPFVVTVSVGPVDAVRICKLYALCRFVNFNKRTFKTTLLATTDELISNTDGMVIDVHQWNDNFLGLCKNHNCPNNTFCKIDGTNFHCESIGCTGHPTVANVNTSSFTRKILWQVDETVEYVCNQGYYTVTNVTGTPSGEWSYFSCIRYSKCTETFKCGPKVTQDYWLFLDKTQALQRIHCRYESPTGPYLTFAKYNMASTPPFIRNDNSCNLNAVDTLTLPSIGETDFQRVRLYMVDLYIITSYTTYTNSTYKFQKYGTAGDCIDGDKSGCGTIGMFIINTSGTGFKVKSTVNWTTWGTDGYLNTTYRSPDGHYIEGLCGGGVNCGGCIPEGQLYLESDLSSNPPFETAELRICKFPLSIQ